MAAVLALAERGRGRTAPNPCVGCVIVRDGRVVGRGWTQPSGRPHAEAMALAQAGDAARGATAYVTLEPCAVPGRGPACADTLIGSGVGRVVTAIGDPFPAVDGAGFRALEAAGIAVTIGPGAAEAERSMAGFLTRQRLGRPHVTLKLATSLDGCIALANGESRWITGPEARAHAHMERARHEAILVGRGTFEADAPRLDVRLRGLEDRSPRRIVLTSNPTSVRHPSEGWGLAVGEGIARPHGDPSLRWGDGTWQRIDPSDGGWEWIDRPEAIAELANVDHLLVEGGARTAAAFLAADLVDRLLLYRAPILIGGGVASLVDIGMTALTEAYARWHRIDTRTLGSDTLEVYQRLHPIEARSEA